MNSNFISSVFKSCLKNTENPEIKSVSPNNIYSAIDKVFASVDNPYILDIGGGRGHNFKKNIKNYYILDLNTKNDSDNFILGDITSSNLKLDKEFDFIISKDTFEHILNPWDATLNIVNNLKEGGYFICIVPFAWRFHPSPYDAYRYSHQGLKFLFEHKDKLEEVVSGYIYYYNTVKGFWSNKLDTWPFGNKSFIDNVCSFYIGKKNSNKKFNINEFRKDPSFTH